LSEIRPQDARRSPPRRNERVQQQPTLLTIPRQSVVSGEIIPTFSGEKFSTSLREDALITLVSSVEARSNRKGIVEMEKDQNGTGRATEPDCGRVRHRP